jgi:hypothetical protein
MDSNITLHHVIQVCNSLPPTPPRSPRSRLPPNHPSLPDEYKIRLNLQTWANIFAEPIDTHAQQRARVDKILNFFIKVAMLNDLDNTLAVQSLRTSLTNLFRLGECSSEIDIDWRARISQLASPERMNYKSSSSMRDLCVHGIPLFNIWDSMSFIYTVCAEDIKTQLGAELHLIQFRIIIRALRVCKRVFPEYAGPNTVAATWTEESKSKPLTIAFATSCVGPSGSGTKPAMAAFRREFMKTVTDNLKNFSRKVNTRKDPPNPPANCPEYLVWPIVCQKPGKYKSLCFNMKNDDSKAAIYRCCKFCEDALYHLGANNIVIDDLWRTSFMGEGTIKMKGPYPEQKMKSLNDILAEFGGRTDL